LHSNIGNGILKKNNFPRPRVGGWDSAKIGPNPAEKDHEMIAKVTTKRAPPKKKIKFGRPKSGRNNKSIRAPRYATNPHGHRSAVAANASSSQIAINTTILVAKTHALSLSCFNLRL